ncbi:hypothetical protein RSJ6_14255 [Clostridium botulinum]|nr:hypothetical protein RSJ6_14255 [Clostridium botulinum]OSA71615.1 hypothetical protein B2H87_06060 [Clostridium botulinum]
MKDQEGRLHGFLRFKKRNLKEKAFRELKEEYILYLQLNKRSVWTIKTYKEKSNSFLKFIGNDFLCTDITEKVIEKYKKELLKTNRETSVNTHLTHLRTIFNFAVERGYMTNVKIDKLEAQEKIKNVYSKEELERLLLEEPRETFMQYQARVIIATFVSTGLRLSELTSLQVRDVDFHNSVIYSRHTKTKKSRILPISTSLRSMLIEWITYRQAENEKDSLFCNSYGEALKQSTLRTLMYRYFTHKNVKNGGIHQFRRTFITYAVQQGVDIISLGRITGHQNLKVLNKYYVNSKERVKNLADTVSPLEKLDVLEHKKKRIKK